MCSLANGIGVNAVPIEVKGEHVVLKLNGAGYVAEALKDPKEKIHLPYLSGGNPELDLAALVHALDALTQEAYKKGVRDGVDLWAEREKRGGKMSRDDERVLREEFGIIKSPYYPIERPL